MIQEMGSTSDKNFLPLGMNDIIKKVFGEEIELGHQQDAHEFLIMLLHSLEGSECLRKDKV